MVTIPSVKVYARAADEGHTSSAYMAGVSYKNRWLGELKIKRGGDISSNNAQADTQLGVLKTDEVAFKYLSQASNAGIGVAMQSLVDCYETVQGRHENIPRKH